MPDAAIPTASDHDGDGVADLTDNCPDVVNPDQKANEDGDKFGDACDPCPLVADNAPADVDRDGIGDACDPNPTLKDTRWLFEGFHMGLPAWARTPNWVAVGDKLRVTAAGNTDQDGDNIVPPLNSPDGTFNNFSITATVVVEARTGTNGDHSIGVEVYDETTQKAVDCALDVNPNIPNGILLLIDDLTNPHLDKEPALAWTNNTEYRITLTRHNQNYTCTVFNASGTQLQTATGTSAVVARSASAVDVWAYGVTGQLGAVFIAGAP